MFSVEGIEVETRNTAPRIPSNSFLDVLSGKASRDYACGIKVDKDFETAVYELRAYFGFFKLVRKCETISIFTLMMVLLIT